MRLRRVSERKLLELEALIERVGVVRRWLPDAAACQCSSLEDRPLFDQFDQLLTRGRSHTNLPDRAPAPSSSSVSARPSSSAPTSRGPSGA